jgi:hypothetical protein
MNRFGLVAALAALRRRMGRVGAALGDGASHFGQLPPAIANGESARRRTPRGRCGASRPYFARWDHAEVIAGNVK